MSNLEHLKEKQRLEESKHDIEILDEIFCQDYSFHGYNLNYTSATDIDYDRIFCFLDLYDEDLRDKTKFSYEIATRDLQLTLKGPFDFKSDIYDSDKEAHKIITYGDTDTYLKGMPTLDRMKEEEYDLLILLGDYSYDIFDNNGQKGDDFFELMEPILTKSPFVYTPGNHETADDSLLLNSRFIMPGTSKDDHLENNFYSFIAGKVLYYSMNLDYVVFTDVTRIANYSERLYLDLKEREEGRGVDWYYLAFFTHRPFYNVERAQRGMVDLYSSLPILNILNHFDIDIILTGHTHDFELSKIYDNYLPTEKSENTLMIISGAAGTDKDPIDSDRYYNLPYNKAYIPNVNGLTELQISKSNIHGIFFKTTDRATLYEFDMKGYQEYEMDIFMILGFLFLALVIIIGLAILLYKFFISEDDGMEEIDNQTDASKQILDDENEPQGEIALQKQKEQEEQEDKDKDDTIMDQIEDEKTDTVSYTHLTLPTTPYV